MFLPIWKDATVSWFSSSELRDMFPIKATADSLLSLLHKRESWVNAIFDLASSSVNKYALGDTHSFGED